MYERKTAEILALGSRGTYRTVVDAYVLASAVLSSIIEPSTSRNDRLRGATGTYGARQEVLILKNKGNATTPLYWKILAKNNTSFVSSLRTSLPVTWDPKGQGTSFTRAGHYDTAFLWLHYQKDQHRTGEMSMRPYLHPNSLPIAQNPIKP